MFIRCVGYSLYPIELGCPRGAVKMTELDKVTVAGTINKESQEKLSHATHVAAMEHRMPDDESFVSS